MLCMPCEPMQPVLLGRAFWGGHGVLAALLPALLLLAGCVRPDQAWLPVGAGGWGVSAGKAGRHAATHSLVPLCSMRQHAWHSLLFVALIPYFPLPARWCRDVSAEALRSLWRVLTEGEVSQEIDEAVRAVLCRMHTEQLQAVSSQQQQ